MYCCGCSYLQEHLPSQGVVLCGFWDYQFGSSLCLTEKPAPEKALGVGKEGRKGQSSAYMLDFHSFPKELLWWGAARFPPVHSKRFRLFLLTPLCSTAENQKVAVRPQVTTCSQDPNRTWSVMGSNNWKSVTCHTGVEQRFGILLGAACWKDQELWMLFKLPAVLTSLFAVCRTISQVVILIPTSVRRNQDPFPAVVTGCRIPYSLVSPGEFVC